MCSRDQHRRRRERKLFSWSFRAKVEESRSVTFKVPSRDPSAALGMTERSSQLRKQGGLSFFFGQRARTLLAFFHDELIQRRINRQWIGPVETSETKRI